MNDLHYCLNQFALVQLWVFKDCDQCVLGLIPHFIIQFFNFGEQKFDERLKFPIHLSCSYFRATNGLAKCGLQDFQTYHIDLKEFIIATCKGNYDRCLEQFQSVMLEPLRNSCPKVIQICLSCRLPIPPALRVVERSPKSSTSHQHCFIVGSGLVFKLVSNRGSDQRIKIFLKFCISFVQFKLVVVRYLSRKVFLVLASW